MSATAASFPFRRVLVTGGAGFLGSHIVEVLRARNVADIVVPRSKDFDLTRRDACERLVAESRPDLVIHAAARVGGIGANRRHPGTFFRDNALMGIDLIEACRPAAERGELKKFVCLGTVCAYPKHTPVPFREDDLWNGYPEETNAPYGVAKKALLVMLQSYRQEFGFPGIFLLPVNLYGPRDHFDLENSHVVPAMIRKFVEAKERGEPEVVLWGDGSPTREFLYVEDAARGIVAAAERYEGIAPVNLGSGNEIAMKDLARLVAAEAGFAGRVVWDTEKPNGQPRRRLDVSRARDFFGWSATTPFSQGLSATTAWFLQHRAAEALAR